MEAGFSVGKAVSVQDAGPASVSLFVFVGRNRTKVKCLYRDRTGFALWCKRFEHGHFRSPAALAQRGFALAELNAWLEGIKLDPIAVDYRTADSHCSSLSSN
ncbi:IS66 family insertion sequence element accessory protein TnpB [Caballeronia glebae]|uniref:IS66 family insertion sequence element accessory protein TnpB n=1 Tax=Caballeronia glebae TaxID=1777143 RepID=UPI000BB44CF2